MAQEQENTQPNVTSMVRYKMIFFALLEAAMRYRESYWREEQEQFSADSLKLFEENAKGLPFHQYKKRHGQVMRIILDRENEQMKLNGVLYKEIESLTKGYSKQVALSFDNYATAYGLVAEHLQKARNTTEFLTICELYNSGTFDKDLQDAIRRGKTEELNDKYENKNHENKDSNSADSSNSSSGNGDNRIHQLQEEQQPAYHNPNIYAPSERADPGHDDCGELQDDRREPDDRDEQPEPDAAIQEF